MPRMRKSETISTRLHEPYYGWLTEVATRNGMKKSHVLKLFAMISLDAGVLGIHDRLKEIEKGLKSLRKDFNDAVEK